MKNTQLQTLQKNLEEINKNISDIRDEINLAEMVIHTNDLSKLFNVTSSVHLYKSLPFKIMPSLPKFMPPKIHKEELLKLFGVLSSSSLASDKHGYSMKTTQKSPEAGPSLLVKQLLDEPETVTTIHTGYRVYNVACQSDEEIWTIKDNTMKLYSINQESLLKSITTKSGNIPNGIVVTKSGNLVYTDTRDRTVNIVKNEKIEEVIRLQNWNQPFSPQGITTDSESHILTADYYNECVHIIDKDGQFLRYIDCGLSYPGGLCIDTNDNLFVTQNGNIKVKKVKYLQGEV
ncbi:uncharacterized protein LOC134281057 [Saccostrea cucullata]|uniref:uncharacterized protein LOC134281057 n=1 Tax=Saccostrea cuccullata TaxID=36930 RepID=UPI002ED60A2B